METGTSWHTLAHAGTRWYTLVQLHVCVGDECRARMVFETKTVYPQHAFVYPTKGPSKGPLPLDLNEIKTMTQKRGATTSGTPRTY
jgi:hypothetical protein